MIDFDTVMKDWKCCHKDSSKYIEDNIKENNVITFTYHYLKSKKSLQLENRVELGRMFKNITIKQLEQLGFKNVEKSINISFTLFTMKAITIEIDVNFLLNEKF